MAEVARETAVATQVAIGNQASEATRRLCEWIWAGAIGPVREVINWSSRPFWPQEDRSAGGIEAVPSDSTGISGSGPGRPSLTRISQPFVWRGWYDFGTGAMGDMGQHSFDTIFRVLKLEAPRSCRRELVGSTGRYLPKDVDRHLHFPARGDTPPVLRHLVRRRAEAQPPRGPRRQTQLDKEGLLFMGDQGKISLRIQRPKLAGDSERPVHAGVSTAAENPAAIVRETLERWLDACKGGPAGRRELRVHRRRHGD